TLALLGGSGAESATFNSASASFGGSISLSGVDSFSFNGGGGNDALTVNAGTVVLPATQVLQSLAIASGATVKLLAGGTKVIKTVSLSLSGTLDLADNAMIESQLPLASILALINLARTPDGTGNPTWSG